MASVSEQFMMPPSTAASHQLPCQCGQAHRIIIVGAGVAGLSAAIWLRRFGLDPIVLEQSCEFGGTLRGLGNLIPDYPGIPKVSGIDLARKLEAHADAVHADMRRNVNVETIDLGGHALQTSIGRLCYDALIIASGSRPRRLGVPGEDAMHARGETPIADTDAHRFVGRHVVVVGGGDRAFEEAIILADAGVRVSLVHRSAQSRAQRRFVDRVHGHPDITLFPASHLVAVHGSPKVSAAKIISMGRHRTLACSAVLVRVGIVGNAEFAQDAISLNDDGFVLVDAACRTSEPGIWAVGDITAPAQIQSISTSTAHAALVAKQLSEISMATRPASELQAH